QQGIGDWIGNQLVTDHLASIVVIANLPPHVVPGKQQRVSTAEHELVEVLAGGPRPVLTVANHYEKLCSADLVVVLEINVGDVSNRIRQIEALEPCQKR